MVRNKAVRTAEIITLRAAFPFWTGDNETSFALQKSLLAEQRLAKGKQVGAAETHCPSMLLTNKDKLSQQWGDRKQN